MGVDIQTYRGRIGCFSRNFGTDVLTVQYIVNFTRGIKTIGTVVFIGILLLLAGIEQNPGPISGDKKKEKPRMSVQNVKSVLESTSRRTPANATTLKVCGLPKDIGIDSLINIFENTRRQGGGNVLRVDFDENNSSALVTFEEAEALQLVLRKRPIHIDGKDVSVEIFYGDYPMNENICSQIDEAGEVCADKPNDLQLGSDSENVNTSGAVAKLASNFTRTVTERVRKGFGFIKSAANFVGQESVAAEIADCRFGRKGPIYSKSRDLFSIMGVDIQTYRGRIGCFSRNFGTDVITVQYIVDFTRGIKTIGAVIFIGILLLLAGIEQNPGPISESKSRRTPANATILKVCSLPNGIGTDSLISIFENTRRQGGGNVLRVDIDKNNSSALVEFEEAEALQLVMRKRPIHINGKDVSAEIYYGEDPLNENNGSQMDHADEVFADKPKHLQLFSDSENVNKSGAVSTLASNFTRTITERVRKGFELIKSAAHFIGQESAAADTADCEQVEGDLKRPDSSKSRDSTETESHIHQILQKLGLTDKYPGKISILDVIAVDPNENIEQMHGKLSLTDIPWLVLKRLMCAHSESRDIRLSEDDNSDNSLNLEDSLSCMSEIPDIYQNISPLDIFTVVFQCCDPFMKQIFVQKLYLCKLAVPFMYWGTRGKQTPVISVWPLRSLAIESNQTFTNINKKQSRETDVLSMQTKLVAFGRLGRPHYSKSKLINSLLFVQGCKTFFNIDCPSGMTPRKLSNGHIEMFWLPTTDEKKDRFLDAMTFFNLRGDLCRHFSTDSLYFIANFIDSIVMIVDLDMVLNQSKKVEDVLLQFSSVILIFAGPFNLDAVRFVKKFQSGVISLKSEISLRILSTHKGTVEQNVVDILSGITNNISDQLKIIKTMSFEERLSQAKLTTIKTDEEDDICQQGKLEATKLVKQMKADGDPNVWKQHLTPVHSNLSKELGKLLKEREREKCFLEGEKINVKIITVRRQQLASITKSVKLFLHILIKNNNCHLILKYFLSWLHFHIEREKRQILQDTVIADFKETNDEASFTVQHFFREIGHINDAILELKEDTTKFGLPSLHMMSNIFSRLLLDGHHFDLIESESFYMPYQWIKAVFKNVDVCIGSSKVLTLSVLGLQNSGKSTLLNTMFGSKFSSRTDRCTRGIHVQLIPTKSTHLGETVSVFSYVLIVDTEGLRSSELSHLQHEHDNELATIITGVGDITMVNIMGENTSEIRDILQVIVQTFLRLKIRNEKLDIRKSCAFIHQNVPDTSARGMIGGISKLMHTLNEMTKESARSQGILDITTFNEVIDFDINSQVWYLNNLRQGNPPMARVHNEYSESVVDIKCKILKRALTMKDKSYKPLTDIVEQARVIWKGVPNEDFSFSFRNSRAMKAYMKMDSVVQVELWRFESLIHDKLTKITQNSFAARTEKLRNLADNLISELYEILLNEKIKTEENIQNYFEGSKYKDVDIQWKRSQQIRVHMLFEELQHIIKEHVEKSRVKRSLEIMIIHCRGKHEEELRKRSMEVANTLKGQELNSEKTDELFGVIWKEFLIKADISFTGTERHRKKMKNIFLTCLETIFNKNFVLLKQALKETDFLTPLSNVKQLAKSFSETGINETDIRINKLQMGKSWFDFSDTLKYVGTRVNKIFESVDVKIKALCQNNDEVTEMSVIRLMHELDSSIQTIESGDSNYFFKVSFYVKILVHVSRHAHPIFESHNEKNFKTHETAAFLERYRVQQKIYFEAHLKCHLFGD